MQYPIIAIRKLSIKCDMNSERPAPIPHTKPYNSNYACPRVCKSQKKNLEVFTLEQPVCKNPTPLFVTDKALHIFHVLHAFFLLYPRACGYCLIPKMKPIASFCFVPILHSITENQYKNHRPPFLTSQQHVQFKIIFFKHQLYKLGLGFDEV